MSDTRETLIARLTELRDAVGRYELDEWSTAVVDEAIAALSSATHADLDVRCNVSELREGEENDGPLQSTDLFLTARGVSLLCNVEAGESFTYSLSVDGKQIQGGIVGATPAGEGPQDELRRMRVALIAAAQFLPPEIPRGPDSNGWQNTVDMVADVLAAPSPRREATTPDEMITPPCPACVSEHGQVDAACPHCKGTGVGGPAVTASEMFAPLKKVIADLRREATTGETADVVEAAKEVEAAVSRSADETTWFPAIAKLIAAVRAAPSTPQETPE